MADGKLRVGVVGAGVMGSCYVTALAEYRRAELAAVCDLDVDRARDLGLIYGAEIVGSVEQMLEEVALDAVVVATPDFAHREPVLACLDAGKAVLCEKPLATTEGDCAAIAGVVKRTGMPFMVNYGNRHRPAAIELRDAIGGGRIGTPQYVYVRLNERLSKTLELSWLPRTSPVWFLMSHCVDLVSWMLDAEFETVTARAVEGAVAEHVPGVPDLVVCLATMESGCQVVVETAWNLPEGFSPNIDFPVQVIGDKGILQADLFPHDLNLYTDAARSLDHTFDVVGPRGHGAGWWQESVRYFVDTVLEGGHLEPCVEDAAQVTRTLLAVEESLSTGETETVSPEH